MSAAAPAAARATKVRDARLDLARGLTMLIIFVAHVPGNSWAEFIPAKMGFSSGAEAFVLCSGLACGIAFGGVFRRQGWIAGAKRIARRIGQLWSAQLLAFAGFAAMLLALDAVIGGDRYLLRYSLGYLVADPARALLNVASLRYVPVYFDILPLYILLLAAAPLMVALATRSPKAALGMSAALWLLVQFQPLNLPAHPSGDRDWYFDPLAWQFLFFLGFGATAGWWRPPEATRARLAAGLAVLIACIPLTFWGAHEAWPWLSRLYLAIYPSEAITTLHPLRLAHALLLGWTFAGLLGGVKERIGNGLAAPIVLVGQQSLITFLTGVFLSALGGVALDLIGRTQTCMAIVNIAGMMALVATAGIARSVKARGDLPRTKKELPPCQPA